MIEKTAKSDDYLPAPYGLAVRQAHDPGVGGFMPALMQQPDHCIVQALIQRASWQSF
jgi:hypothetical protein